LSLDESRSKNSRWALFSTTQSALAPRSRTWDANCAGIRDQSCAGVVQVEQDVHRDLAENCRVLRVEACLLHVMREHLRLDVTLHVARPEQLLLEPQHRHSERHIQTHPKGRRGQHQPADWRCEVMHPRSSHDCADAVRNHDHVFDGDSVLLRNVANERVHVANHHPDVLRRAPFARRIAVSTRIPRENLDCIETQRFHGFLPAARMFMATMKKQEVRASRVAPRANDDSATQHRRVKRTLPERLDLAYSYS
jgi:hypothetical protein